MYNVHVLVNIISIDQSYYQLCHRYKWKIHPLHITEYRSNKDLASLSTYVILWEIEALPPNLITEINLNEASIVHPERPGKNGTSNERCTSSKRNWNVSFIITNHGFA